MRFAGCFMMVSILAIAVAAPSASPAQPAVNPAASRAAIVGLCRGTLARIDEFVSDPWSWRELQAVVGTWRKLGCPRAYGLESTSSSVSGTNNPIRWIIR